MFVNDVILFNGYLVRMKGKIPFIVVPRFHNLMPQIVSYTEPSEKSSLETIWKRAGTFKKYWAGDWMNHLLLSIMV